MKKLLFLLFLPLQLLAQDHRIQDYNFDGQLDSLYWEHSSGSSVGFLKIYLCDQASSKTLQIESDHPFSNFLQVFSLPEIPGYTEEVWLNIFQEVCQYSETTKNDLSLEWLLAAYRNYPERDSTEGLKNVFQVNPDWQNGTAKLPDLNIKYIEKTTLSALRKSHWVVGDSTAQQAILLYYGHNHANDPRFELKETPFEGGLLKQTKHGIIWEKEGAYSWVFAHDRPLFGGPYKLRWKSIHQSFIYKDFLILEIRGSVIQDYHVLLIHPESGMIGTIFRDGYFSGNNFKITLEDYHLKITVYEEVQQFDLKDLGQQLLDSR